MADVVDRTTNSTVIQYAVQSILKGKSVKAAAAHAAKNFSGSSNMFLGPGINFVDADGLEAALWDYLADNTIENLGRVKAGAEDFALGSTLSLFFGLDAAKQDKNRPKLKALVISRLGHNPFKAD